MYEYENQSELVLIKRAKKGDTKAFATLYGRIYVDLYRFALYTMQHRQDAEDAVSEAVIAAFQNMKKLKKEEAFRNWMFTILSNQCKKKFSEKSRIEDELSEEVISGQECISTGESHLADCHDLHKALEKLTEEERLIVMLLAIEGYNSSEVGEMLKMSANTIRSKQSRSLEKMRNYLE
ncbi:MAG: RNA polymerase sigma factor [Hespellia sp.]|nr:RNA polymerase sigma factor [Hespellia sp.]